MGRTTVISLFFLALIVGALLYFNITAPQVPPKTTPEMPSQPTIDFQGLDAELSALHALYDDHYPLLPQGWQEHLTTQNALCDWFMLDDYMERSEITEAQKAMELFQINAQDMMQTYGVHAHYWLGELAFQTYLDLLSPQKDKACSELKSLCTKVKEVEVHAAFCEKPSILSLLKQETLLDENHLPKKDGLDRFHLLFRDRWFKNSDTIVAPSSLILPQEIRLLIRWKIEEAHISNDAKLQLIEKNQNLYPLLYNYQEAKAILYHKQGKDTEAALILQNLVESEEYAPESKEKYQQWLNILQKNDRQP